MINPKILIVEDEVDVRDYLLSVLQDEGFTAVGVADGMNLIDHLRKYEPNLVLMDYRLPGKSGVELVQQVRGYADFNNIPFIMVTGLDGEDEKVAALELGADDYIVKPFLPRELAARIRAVLRRVSDQNANPVSQLEAKDLVIDLKSHSVFLQGSEIHLTLTEFRILVALLRNKGRVLSRDQLREEALGNLNVTDRTIDVHMASLRKKLNGCADFMQTVRGVGYRFTDS
ncbi:MAG: response regulator transcription factor [Bdellovibrionales bacterium]|nr:response regulator transcription factor [Bdellovibrionales bacterium]